MKPEYIFLIRHGESEGNVDKSIYPKKPDYTIELTSKGREQARNTGALLVKNYGFDFAFYYSPFFRAIQTMNEIASEFKSVGVKNNLICPSLNELYVKEEPRIREQEWRSRLTNFDHDAEKERDEIGSFYYRFHGGESCADVYDRVSGFYETLYRDFADPTFPKHCAFVCHGMTIRLLLMKWFHYSVSYFETMSNPRNGQAYILKLDHRTNSYNLITPARIKTVKLPTCKLIL